MGAAVGEEVLGGACGKELLGRSCWRGAVGEELLGEELLCSLNQAKPSRAKLL